MFIRKKRIRTINNVSGVQRGDNVVVALRDLDRFTIELAKAGFSQKLDVGESVLPTALGPISSFNAEGKYEVHKDQPKETAYRLSEWRWQEFRGRYDTVEKSKIVEIPYERFPRAFIDPRSAQLTVAQDDEGNKILRSNTHNFIEINDGCLIHIVNLFLEVFGECELLREDLTPLIPARLIRLNWKVLPEGRMPWEKLQLELRPIIERQSPGNRPVINKRHEAISAYAPEFVAVGHGGFDGYVIFGFPSKRLYILESTQVNNATYVLDKDWKDLSCMTKAELLNNDLHKERIIHRENWFSEMNRVLNT